MQETTLSLGALDVSRRQEKERIWSKTNDKAPDTSLRNSFVLSDDTLPATSNPSSCDDPSDRPA
jgi:hypothetical protein